MIMLIFYNCNGNGEMILNMETYGIVDSKYIDQKNHEILTFNIKEHDQSYSFIADYYPGAWDYTSIGDSVIKNKGETFITIKKINGEFVRFETRLK